MLNAKEVAPHTFFLQPMVTMSAIRIASALNLYPRGHLLLLLRVDAVPVRELQTSLTLPHLLSADHVVSVTYSILWGIAISVNKFNFIYSKIYLCSCISTIPLQIPLHSHTSLI